MSKRNREQRMHSLFKKRGRKPAQPDFYFGNTEQKVKALKHQVAIVGTQQEMGEYEFTNMAARALKACQRQHERFYGLDNKYTGNGKIRE